MRFYKKKLFLFAGLYAACLSGFAANNESTNVDVATPPLEGMFTLESLPSFVPMNASRAAILPPPPAVMTKVHSKTFMPVEIPTTAYTPAHSSSSDHINSSVINSNKTIASTPNINMARIVKKIHVKPSQTFSTPTSIPALPTACKLDKNDSTISSVIAITPITVTQSPTTVKPIVYEKTNVISQKPIETKTVSHGTKESTAIAPRVQSAQIIPSSIVKTPAAHPKTISSTPPTKIKTVVEIKKTMPTTESAKIKSTDNSSSKTSKSNDGRFIGN